VETQREEELILDVGGVGYKIACTNQTLEKNRTFGATAHILTELIVREDGWFLYGFSEEQERATFRLLTSVQGIGPKVALGILSTLGVERLYEALLHQEPTVLCQAEGVGPKLARRLINELKDKNMSFSLISSTVSGGPADTLLQDVLSALAHLGYRRAEAFEVANRIRTEHPQIAFEELFRESLRFLSPGKET
jgi:Holliday junction DNA helicase RuvA